jgi:hypothetical protein
MEKMEAIQHLRTRMPLPTTATPPRPARCPHHPHSSVYAQWGPWALFSSLFTLQILVGKFKSWAKRETFFETRSVFCHFCVDTFFLSLLFSTVFLVNLVLKSCHNGN